MTRRINICVLIDALGWKFIEGRDFLGDLLPHRTPLRSVLGYSSGAIPTLLTGKSPSEHGHWNLFYYDPEGSPFRWLRHFDFLPRAVLDHRVTRKILKEIGRRVLGQGPLFECCVRPSLLRWFSYVEKRNIYSPGGIPNAHSIFDELVAKGVSFQTYSYHQWTDSEILTRVLDDLERGEDTFFFLYLSEVDALLHHHCEDEVLLDERFAWYEENLRKVFLEARRKDPEASFTIFSDHGMTPVREHVNLVHQIEALGFQMPDDYLAVYDSTMARFWFFNDRARRDIVQELQSQPCSQILSDQELAELGILFSDRRYGEVVVLLEPGWLFSESDFNGNGWQPKGMHGYHPDDPYTDGVFLSGRTPELPVRTLTDVYTHLQGMVG